MKISIKNIADKLGVSAAVVSLVLNGKEKEGRINKTTAEKIRALAAELNYSPNRFAKGLKKGKSNILGLIVADISNPFYAKLTRHIEDEAECFNYKVIFGSSDESVTKMASIIEVMKTYHVDGFIIVPSEKSQNQIEQLIFDKYPVILVDRYFPELKVDNILVNNDETAFNATNYLLKQGCKNVACFAYKSELLHFHDRIIGYKKALDSAGLFLSKDAIHYIRFDYLYHDMRTCIEKILKSKTPFDGIFFSTDTLALNGIKVLMELSIGVPEKFKIVSFDENDTFDFLSFTVPHFSQPLEDIGKEAVRRIIVDIEENSASKHEPLKIILSAEWHEK